MIHKPVLKSGDAGYLPGAGTEEPCCEVLKRPHVFGCTRRSGHEGDHAAHDPEWSQLASWPRRSTDRSEAPEIVTDPPEWVAEDAPAPEVAPDPIEREEPPGVEEFNEIEQAERDEEARREEAEQVGFWSHGGHE